VPVAGKDHLILRRTGHRLALTACMAGLALTSVARFLVADAGAREQPRLTQQLISLSFALAWAWMAIAVARQGIWANGDGVVVRNVFRRHTLRWSDIECIDPPRRYGALRNAGIQFRLHDGRTVKSSLYVAGPLNRLDFADEVVQALRDLGRRVGPSPADV
jgi:hypothetical protein